MNEICNRPPGMKKGNRNHLFPNQYLFSDNRGFVSLTALSGNPGSTAGAIHITIN